MGLYLRDKFQVSSMIETSFRQGWGGEPHHPPQNEPLRIPPRLMLRKRVLKICSKFTGEHPCPSVISDFGMGAPL